MQGGPTNTIQYLYGKTWDFVDILVAGAQYEIILHTYQIYNFLNRAPYIFFILAPNTGELIQYSLHLSFTFKIFENKFNCMIGSKHRHVPQELISTAAVNSRVWINIKNILSFIF